MAACEDIRRRIDKALATGSLTGPDGVTTEWALLGSHAAVLSGAERGQAERIATT